jgi:hypothetical protein
LPSCDRLGALDQPPDDAGTAVADAAADAAAALPSGLAAEFPGDTAEASVALQFNDSTTVVPVVG